MIDLILNSLLFTLLWQVIVILCTIAIWHRTPKIAYAPALDVVISLLTWIPWVVAAVLGGWLALVACIAGQVLSLFAFTTWHERVRKERGASSIKKTLNKIVGPARNHTGLWFTVPALPVFLMIRLAEVVFYPGLIKFLDFPRYNQAEWVNVSRQKFDGLVGHDLVWCLYCDWMTGVYSLGAEMLRSVESFWCPIQFDDPKKCENCMLDFPDLHKWVKPDSCMNDVTRILEEQYPKGENEPRSWWGHPERKGSAE